MRTHTIRVDPYGRVLLTVYPDGNRPGAKPTDHIFGAGRIHLAVDFLQELLYEDARKLPRPLPRVAPEFPEDFRYGGTDPDGEAA